MDYDWPDITNTPAQRLLIAAHNAGMRAKYPNLVELPPLVRKSHQLKAGEGWGGGNSR